MLLKKTAFFLGFGIVLGSASAMAQTADEAWLRPMAIDQRTLPLNVRALGTGVLEKTAVDELKRIPDSAESSSAANAKLSTAGEIIIGTVREFHHADLDVPLPTDLKPGGYWIFANLASGPRRRVIVAGADDAGVLYGAFALLRLQISLDKQNLHDHPVRSSPVFSVRWSEEWDNADGSVERGYAGKSIFFDDGKVRDDLAAVSEYARLLASTGMNGCNVNNVNNAAVFLQPETLKGLARIADAMRPWGVRLAMSVDVASPQKVGGLESYDPLDPAVKAWW